MRTMGIIGFGAFGQLAARHLAPHCTVLAFDPGAVETPPDLTMVKRVALAEAAACDVVVFATPVTKIKAAIIAARPYFQPGALVLDVASVKIMPAQLLLEEVPPGIDIVGTHPLFGPQSARHGIDGLKIAVCPLRGERAGKVVRFLEDKLKLQAIVTTPDAHDREVATVQGLTHLIANVLVAMGPLPTSLTTRSYELILQSIEMVRYDSTDVFMAIEKINPYSAEVRRRFFELAATRRVQLEESEMRAQARPD